MKGFLDDPTWQGNSTPGEMININECKEFHRLSTKLKTWQKLTKVAKPFPKFAQDFKITWSHVSNSQLCRLILMYSLLFCWQSLAFSSCWTSPDCGQHSSLSSVWMVSFPFVLIQQKHYCSRGRRQKDWPLIIRFSFWRLPLFPPLWKECRLLSTTQFAYFWI